MTRNQYNRVSQILSGRILELKDKRDELWKQAKLAHTFQDLEEANRLMTQSVTLQHKILQLEDQLTMKYEKRLRTKKVIKFAKEFGIALLLGAMIFLVMWTVRGENHWFNALAQ